jgi:choline-glycine betaine transporter
LVVASLIAPEAFLRVATALNDGLLAMFGSAFAWAGFGFVLLCLWAGLSPLGRVRIGGRKAKRLLSPISWSAITLTTTIAIGILFWGTAEPIYHLIDPGGTGVGKGSEDAAHFAMSSLFMHWAVTPYAIYTVPGLTFALCYYNLKRPFSLASPIGVLFGRTPSVRVADGIDALALLALLFGLSASLGAGILTISGGLADASGAGWATGAVGMAGVALAIIAAFFISSATGLHRGIRVLSNINTVLFIALIAFVLIAGPTLAMLSLGADGAAHYAAEFLPRSLLLPPFDNRDWLNSWTVFYFANWMAWAPLAALFLGRISRGYTVRAYILVNLILPAAFSMLWMTVFGGASLLTEMAEPDLLQDALNTDGPEFVLYALLDTLPWGGIVAVGVVGVSFLSYVTAADSNMDVISSLCLPGESPDAKRLELTIKAVFAIAVGFAAWIMISLSGIDGIRMLSSLGGLPALFILLAFGGALVRLGTTHRRAINI